MEVRVDANQMNYYYTMDKKKSWYVRDVAGSHYAAFTKQETYVVIPMFSRDTDRLLSSSEKSSILQGCMLLNFRTLHSARLVLGRYTVLD